MNLSSQRKNKGANFRVYVATSFPNAVFCEIEALAGRHSLANAQVVRELFLRGLAAYYRDGKLSEIATPDGDELASSDESTDERVANVAA